MLRIVDREEREEEREEERAWIFDTILNQQLENKIIDNFQKFTGSNILPAFDIRNNQITFSIITDKTENTNNIKISRGEESVFVWSILFTILVDAVDSLNEKPEDRITTIFNNFKYVVIDDPVSSMDDTRIITIALELINLINKSKNQLKFLITTHHALFFNVLFHARKNKKPGSKFYILTKSNTNWNLEEHETESPFAYHLEIISEIDNAIEKNILKKYHFNLFRALLEKTANFLGYEGWRKLVDKIGYDNATTKTINHFSHDTLSDLDPKNVSEEDKENFANAFNQFIQYFKWGMAEDE